MATADILSQDEIDALLGGMGDSDESAAPEEVPADGNAHPFDFSSQDRIIRGRMPTLEMVNERFARNFRVSLFNLLRRSPEIGVGNVQLLKYSEYVQGLFMPANMNIVKVKPLRGSALFTFDPKLIYGLVDNYFGGSGLYHMKIEGRDFSSSELRVVEIVLERLFGDLQQAWAPVLPIDLSFVGAEVNPHLANIVSPSEVVVVTIFTVELEGGGGEFHIAMPYSMIEPIREVLDTGVQSDRSDHDDRWVTSLREEVLTAPVELVVGLSDKEIPLRSLTSLKAGDVIPIEVPDEVVGTVEDIPIVKARFGVHDGQYALLVQEVICHERPSGPVAEDEDE